MIERLYVHNYRCLENFTLDLKGKGSALLIGKNGSGKSTVRQALGVLQSIARGVNRPSTLIEARDFTQHRTDVPMRFELTATLADVTVSYTISFKLENGPGNHPEPIVLDEVVTLGGVPVLSRLNGEITILNNAPFPVSPTVVTLDSLGSVIKNRENAIPRFCSFLASMVLVAPVPSLMTGYSEGEDDRLDVKAMKFADWFQSLLSQNPAAYVDVESYLREVIRDFGHLARRPRAKSAGNLVVVFKGSESGAPLAIDFGRLSDGEKCFFLSAAVLGYAKHAGPVFCFWDEPDNHLSLPEVGHFILELRRIANQGGQFVATTHNPEAIRRFSAENTLVLSRNSHLEPTLIRPLSEITYNGDLINALIRDEVIG